MKTKINNRLAVMSILSILFILPLFGIAKEDFTKTNKKEFSIQKDAKLSINTEFTDIKAFNWDKDKISIEVSITVSAKNESDAQKKYERAEVKMEGSPTEVSLYIGLNSNLFKNNSNDEIDMEVIIYYPNYIQLDLRNEFGGSLFEDIFGKVETHTSYGSFEARDLTNDELELDSEFGSISIRRFQAGKVNIAYGNLNIEEAFRLRLDSEFSTNEISKVEELDLKTAYDKCTIDECGSAKIESEFSGLRIDQLLNKLEIEIAYGSLKLNSIAPEFSYINIDSEFTGVKLEFDSPLNFAFKVSAEMGDFKYPKELAKITHLQKEMLELDMEGYFGSAKGQSPKVIISIENASASIVTK